MVSEAPRLAGLSGTLPQTTVPAQILQHRDVESTSLRFGDESWSWAEHVEAAARRAAWLDSIRVPGSFHVGVLLENVPDMPFFLAAAGIAGAVVVSLNPTRRGADLARDIAHTHCQVLVTDSTFADHLADVEVPFDRDRIVNVDSPEFAKALAEVEPRYDPAPVEPDDLFLLIFTSGTSGAPKAVKFSHGKVTAPGNSSRIGLGIEPDDVVYTAMPLFHSNAILVGWGLSLASGATLVLRRRFSASGFLPDVRKYGVTYFHYVGRPLSYILATPEQPDDADNPLKVVVGNEGAEADLKRFGERFGCHVLDGFGSTEGGVFITRTPDMPPGSLGMPGPGIIVADPETSEECPPGVVGELVNTSGAGQFQGYYNNAEADAERMRNGWYWSGDLAYRDEAGFVFFVGRTLDWLRVDGENFGAAPVERVFERHPDVVLAPVYAVPAADAGDELMTALLLRDGASFDPDDFAAFLAAQGDLGTKWVPRFIRIATTLPQTQTNKVLKRVLAAERWGGADPVWYRPGKAIEFRPLTADDIAAIEADFASHGRSHVLT